MGRVDKLKANGLLREKQRSPTSDMAEAFVSVKMRSRMIHCRKN